MMADIYQKDIDEKEELKQKEKTEIIHERDF